MSHRTSWTNRGFEPASHEDLLPVLGISWWDPVVFCNLMSDRPGVSAAYRIRGDDVTWDTSAEGYWLPSEAEWERACREDMRTVRNVERNVAVSDGRRLTFEQREVIHRPRWEPNFYEPA